MRIRFEGDTGPLVPGVQNQQSAYELYGLTVESNIELPELDSICVSRPTCHFELLEVMVPEPIPEEFYRQDYYLDSGKLWRSCAQTPGGFLLRFHNQADFFVSAGGERITCHPTDNTSAETVRHLLLDHVIPRCLNLYGKEAFHGSAVATPYGVCGFLGGTGTGKSTLAASLYSAGCRLFGDDCLVLMDADEQIVAIPTYPGFRLWPQAVAALFGDLGPLPRVCHYSQKRRLAADVCGTDSLLPIRALFVLATPGASENDAIRIEQLSTNDGLAGLLRTVFRLDPVDRGLLASQFQFFARLLLQTPVYRLSYPRDFSILSAVRQRIFETLQGTSVAAHSPRLSAS